MEGYQTRALPSIISTTKLEALYKVDEGYSEGNRSQDDPDSPMRMEPGSEGMLPTQMTFDAVLALNENDRSGEYGLSLNSHSFLMLLYADARRICLQHITHPQSFVYSFCC